VSFITRGGSSPLLGTLDIVFKIHHHLKMRKLLSIIASTSILLAFNSSYTFAESNRDSALLNREQVKQTIQEKQQEREQDKEELKNQIQERNEIKTQLQEKVQEKKVELEQKKASVEAKIKDLRNQRIMSYWSNIQDRLQGVINRLNNITDRINSRLAIVETQTTKDLTGIRDQIAQAQETIADAQIKLNAINTDFDSVLNSSNPQTAFKGLITDIKAIRDDLVKAHRLLIHVIGDIQGLRVGQTDTGTTGTSVTPTPELTETPTETPTLTPTPTT
jgi:chromosome segregation ATPase